MSKAETGNGLQTAERTRKRAEDGKPPAPYKINTERPAEQDEGRQQERAEKQEETRNKKKDERRKQETQGEERKRTAGKTEEQPQQKRKDGRKKEEKQRKRKENRRRGNSTKRKKDENGKHKEEEKAKPVFVRPYIESANDNGTGGAMQTATGGGVAGKTCGANTRLQTVSCIRRHDRGTVTGGWFTFDKKIE